MNDYGIGVVDLETGKIFLAKECSMGKRRGGGNQSAARNRRSIEAFLKYCEAKRPEGSRWYGSFLTYGAGLGVENYNLFQAGMDRMVRTIKGPYVYCVEVGSLGKKLHVHMITQEYQNHEDVRSNWYHSIGIKSGFVGIQGIPQSHLDVNEDRVTMERLPGYLVKYMTKAKEWMPGVRTYRTCKGLRKITQKYYETAGFNVVLCEDWYTYKKEKELSEKEDVCENIIGDKPDNIDDVPY